MTIYAVLAPPARAGSTDLEPDRFRFIKEGFCWPAFAIAIPWLIWHRMWLVLILYVLVTVAVFALAGHAPLPVAWTAMVLFGVLVGLEGNNLRRWTLERRGFRFLGVAGGDRRDEAEYRFFATWTAPQAPDETQKPTATKPFAPIPAGVGEIIGLFPSPGARP
jgi:hypothetical protein